MVGLCSILVKLSSRSTACRSAEFPDPVLMVVNVPTMELIWEIYIFPYIMLVGLSSVS